MYLHVTFQHLLLQQDYHMKEIYQYHMQGQIFIFPRIFPICRLTVSLWNKLPEIIKEIQSLDT